MTTAVHRRSRWARAARYAAGSPRSSASRKELRKEFSTRRRAIGDELGRTATSGRKAAQRAAYVTRPAKSHTPQTSLRASWAQRAEALGRSAPTVVADSIGRAATPQWPATASLTAELFGPHGLTEQSTSFDQRDVIQALTETLPAGAGVTGQQLEATATELLGHDDAVPQRTSAGPRAATLLRNVRSRRDSMLAALSPDFPTPLLGSPA